MKEKSSWKRMKLLLKESEIKEIAAKGTPLNSGDLLFYTATAVYGTTTDGGNAESNGMMWFLVLMLAVGQGWPE